MGVSCQRHTQCRRRGIDRDDFGFVLGLYMKLFDCCFSHERYLHVWCGSPLDIQMHHQSYGGGCFSISPEKMGDIGPWALSKTNKNVNLRDPNAILTRTLVVNTIEIVEIVESGLIRALKTCK